MTNHWTDIKNSDYVLIIGSNAAENHPISFKWITEAKLNGAKVIHADPRYTRTSAKADIYAPIRSGTDIAFMGGMIRYVLEDMRQHPEDYNVEYVSQYTNAALIINAGIELPGDNDGVFSGLSGGAYDRATWNYANTSAPDVEAKLLTADWSGWSEWTDLNQRCVLRLLWDHYSRYTLEKVSQITGCDQATLEAVYSTYAQSGQPDKAGTIMYAMGTTQHTYGTQNIRSYAILQLLLGNVGVAGGGINALRGESNVQGSTDMCLLWHILPGYLAMIDHADLDVDTYVANHAPAMVTPNGLDGDKSLNWWSNYKKYIVSLVTAWYRKLGDDPPAAADLDEWFNRLPKVRKGENYSHIRLFEKIDDEVVKGLMCWGQNPAVGGPMAGFERRALEKLDWLVCVDLWETETSAFWKPENPSRSKATGDIATEVYLLPAAASYEKEGSITNSGRWAQWRYKAVEPPGEARDDLWIMDKLTLKLKGLYSIDDDAPNRDAIVKLAWEHGDDADKVAREINGYDYTTGKLVPAFTKLADDGSTSSGNWLYCDMYTEEEGNRAKWRDPVDHHPRGIGLYSNWAWCWPVNRRIIYNRSSVALDGTPYNPPRAVIEWNGSGWVGDVPDGGSPPIADAAVGSKVLPFIMQPEGVAHIWGWRTMKDGPLPEVYEPWESPLTANLMGHGQLNDPTAFLGGDRGDPGAFGDYPYVATTYRVTEEWQAGQMTRNLPWLVELMPEMFVEIGEDLAGTIGIANGDRVKVKSARGEITAVAIVTRRLNKLPVKVGGNDIYHVGIPWHWGYTGLSTGDSGNVLTPHVGDANTAIPEYKTFLCNIEKV